MIFDDLDVTFLSSSISLLVFCNWFLLPFCFLTASFTGRLVWLLKRVVVGRVFFLDFCKKRIFFVIIYYSSMRRRDEWQGRKIEIFFSFLWHGAQLRTDLRLGSLSDLLESIIRFFNHLFKWFIRFIDFFRRSPVSAVRCMFHLFIFVHFWS